MIRSVSQSSSDARPATPVPHIDAPSPIDHFEPAPRLRFAPRPAPARPALAGLPHAAVAVAYALPQLFVGPARGAARGVYRGLAIALVEADRQGNFRGWNCVWFTPFSVAVNVWVCTKLGWLEGVSAVRAALEQVPRFTG